MIKKLLLIRAVPLLFNVACLLLISPLLVEAGLKSDFVTVHQETVIAKQDTLMTDTLDEVGLDILNRINSIAAPKNVKDSIDIRKGQVTPFISLQQILKGNVDGVAVHETSDELGKVQAMIIRVLLLSLCYILV